MKTPEEKLRRKKDYNRQWMREWYRKNKKKARAQKRKDYWKHVAKRRAASRAWGENHREVARARSKKHYQENRKKYLARALAWQKIYRQNPNKKLRDSLSTRMRLAIKGGTKSAKTLKLLGCSILQVRLHLEKQFKPGMNWENYGLRGWHVDHIQPCARFDLTKPDQQRRCFHYKNLQPLWAEENFSKGCRGF